MQCLIKKFQLFFHCPRWVHFPLLMSLSFGHTEKMEHINMHLWGLSCTCARFLVRDSSMTVGSSFWNVGMECIDLTLLSYLQACLFHPSFSLQIYSSDIGLLMGKLVSQHPSLRDSPLLMRLLPFLALRSLLPCFVLICKEKKFNITILSPSCAVSGIILMPVVPL